MGRSCIFWVRTRAHGAGLLQAGLMMDEYMWIRIHSIQCRRPAWRCTKVAPNLLVHPSAITHEAYDFWSAKDHEDRFGKLDVSYEHLNGALGPNGQWRQIVTIEDAIAGGCDLFDIDQLRLRYTDSQFANLLMCQFMDDSMSEFPFAMLEKCMLDVGALWTDFKPCAADL